MVIMVVDQRDIQKRGGVCARIPVSCIVHAVVHNAGLALGRLTVFDVTYGEGRFYAAERPELLIGADIAVLSWVVEPDVFIRKPVWTSWKVVKRLGVKPNMVVVDPPWSERGSSRRRHHGIESALGTPKVILRYAVEACINLDVEYMLIHYRERYVPKGFELVSELLFVPVTRYLNNKLKMTTWFGVVRRLGA